LEIKRGVKAIKISWAERERERERELRLDRIEWLKFGYLDYSPSHDKH
jgi:hypothetical protein